MSLKTAAISVLDYGRDHRDFPVPEPLLNDLEQEVVNHPKNQIVLLLSEGWSVVGHFHPMDRSTTEIMAAHRPDYGATVVLKWTPDSFHPNLGYYSITTKLRGETYGGDWTSNTAIDAIRYFYQRVLLVDGEITNGYIHPLPEQPL